MNKYKEHWDKTHYKYFNGKINVDNWLDKYMQLINSCEYPIMDLGCGIGNNVKYLLECGKSVVACDYSDSALEVVQSIFLDDVNNKRLKLLKFDISNNFPIKKENFELIISDLSLHYFDKKTTIKILEEIKRILVDGGCLLFRVNSINDLNYGTKVGKEIEPHFYFTQGYEKRFFDLNDINYFFGNWIIKNLNEKIMYRYESKKILWEGLAKIKR